MKKIITTLAIALSVMVSAEAQTEQRVTRPTPEAKLIGSNVVGSNLVSLWLVNDNTTGDDDFTVRYQINMANMDATYNGNSEELNKFKTFMSSVTDGTKSITSIDICGYASPDGLESANDKLAMARAQKCRAYLEKLYPTLTDIAGETKGISQPWSAAKAAITNSSAPSKSSLIDAINSSTNEAVIEDKLRDISASWDYIVANILPPMRCVEITVTYDNWSQLETYTPVEVVGEIVIVEPDGSVEVVEIVEPEPRYIVIDQYEPDVMIIDNNIFAPIDFREDRSKMKFKDRRRREKMKYRYR